VTIPRLGWRTWFLAALGVNAVHLLVRAGQRCFGSDLLALAATVPDDSFYYLVPAFRFRECGFWTFDGEHPTFGVQPVYAWFLTGLGALFDDRFAFFRAAMWANYAFFAATSVAIAGFLYRLVRPCGAFRAGLAAVVGAHGFLLNATLVHGYASLKENALYALLLISSAWLAHRASLGRTRHRLLWCGFVTGLAVSCRITPSTLLVAATTCLFAAGGLRLRSLLALAGGMAAAVLPWALNALVVFGRVLPTTGSLKTKPFVDAVRDGTFGERLPELLAQVGPYLADVFAYSLGRPSGLALPQGDPAPSVLSALFPFLLLGSVLAFHRRHALRACPGAALVPAAIAAATLGTAATLLVLGVGRLEEVRHYYTWYIADLPVLLAVMAPLAASFAEAPERATGAASARATDGVGAALAAGLILAGLLAPDPIPVLVAFRQDEGSWNTQAVALAERANAVLGADDRAGAHNAGVIGFLANATVVNLDGLANDDVVAARARGTTMLEYVRAGGIDHLLDPLRPQGWFGNPFDRVEIVDAVPFRLDVPAAEREYYDGYFLLRLVEERFPRFEPEVEGGGVRVVPWMPVDPLGSEGRAVRCFRFEPAGGTATAVFHTLRAYSSLRFRVGCERPDSARAPAALTIRDDSGKVLHASSPGRAETVAVACEDADRIHVEVASADVPTPVVWLTGVSFQWSSAGLDAEAAFLAYGSGCNARASADSAPPRLDADGDPSSGAFRFVCTDAPPGAAGILALGSAPISRALEGGCTALVERSSSIVALQVKTDEHGRAELRVTIPARVPAGFAYAQVAFRDPDDPRRFFATTNGMRVLLRK
jgi:hypothetical protein